MNPIHQRKKPKKRNKRSSYNSTIKKRNQRAKPGRKSRRTSRNYYQVNPNVESKDVREETQPKNPNLKENDKKEVNREYFTDSLMNRGRLLFKNEKNHLSNLKQGENSNVVQNKKSKSTRSGLKAKKPVTTLKKSKKLANTEHRQKPGLFGIPSI